MPYNGPAVPALTAAFGGVPISEIDRPLLGSLNGNVRDVGIALAQLRPVRPGSRAVVAGVAPDLGVRGPLNFQVGVFYLESDDNTNYYVVTSELDYWAQVTRRTRRSAWTRHRRTTSTQRRGRARSSAVFGELY